LLQNCDVEKKKKHDFFGKSHSILRNSNFNKFVFWGEKSKCCFKKNSKFQFLPLKSHFLCFYNCFLVISAPKIKNKIKKNNIQKKFQFQKNSKIQFLPLKLHFIILTIYAPKIKKKGPNLCRVKFYNAHFSLIYYEQVHYVYNIVLFR
jgi:hypothetical protein